MECSMGCSEVCWDLGLRSQLAATAEVEMSEDKRKDRRLRQDACSRITTTTTTTTTTTAAALYRLYLGIADGMSVARVWACRYSPRRSF